MTDSPAAAPGRPGPGLACIVANVGDPDDLAPMVSALREQVPGARLLAVVGDGSLDGRLAALGVTAGISFDELFADASAGDHVLVCDGAAVFEAGAISGIVAELEADLGVGSIGLLTPGLEAHLEALSEPTAHRHDAPVLGPLLTGAALRPFSVPWIVSPVVALSRGALSRLDRLPPGPSVAARLVAWSEAVSARAFCHLVHPARTAIPVALTEVVGAVAAGRVEEAVADDVGTADSARLVRVAMRGLRVHIDGRTFEAAETGTEVQALNLIRALARRPEITYIGVNLRESVPPYTEPVLRTPGVTAYEHCGEWSPHLPRTDVFHRPYQPYSREDCELWRTVGARTACTVQDLITFLSPEYHESFDAWRAARTRTRAAVSSVDGVFCVSDYVSRQIEREGLRAGGDEMWTAHNGVDHIEAAAPLAQPPELSASGHPFALVLASNYGHKNLDLAVAAVAAARLQGVDLLTVTAGRQVAHGSAAPSGDGTVGLARNVDDGGAQLAARQRRGSGERHVGGGLRAGAVRGGVLRHADGLGPLRRRGRGARRPAYVRRRLERRRPRCRRSSP